MWLCLQKERFTVQNKQQKSKLNVLRYIEMRWITLKDLVISSRDCIVRLWLHTLIMFISARSFFLNRRAQVLERTDRGMCSASSGLWQSVQVFPQEEETLEDSTLGVIINVCFYNDGSAEAEDQIEINEMTYRGGRCNCLNNVWW